MANQNALLGNSELLIDLTFQTRFCDLDSRFVHAVVSVLGCNSAELYIGHYNYDDAPKLIAEFQSSQEVQLHGVHTTILPIFLVSGSTLSLLLDTEPTEVNMLALAQLIAVYVNQNEHLTRANKDRLTGLNNRRSFDVEYLRLVSELADKPEATGAIAIIDVDHFKAINDSFGHIIGDETLITLSNMMKVFFEQDDVLYRFGGEEFIVLFRGVSMLEAEIILQQLRKQIEQHLFAQVGSLTVSMGLVPLVNIDSVLLFERADAALYAAKRSGRNCIKSYDDLVARGDIQPIDYRSGDVELF